jgi:hypothetical protein
MREKLSPSTGTAIKATIKGIAPGNSAPACDAGA